jgi:hypothetical protein
MMFQSIPRAAASAALMIAALIDAAQAAATGFVYTNSAQSFSVTQTGLYDLFVAGAEGGSGRFGPTGADGFAGGKGATASGRVMLTAGTVLTIIVGGHVSSFLSGLPYSGAGGGGGGSFIYSNPTTPLIIASGGGGGSQLSAGSAGWAAPFGRAGGANPGLPAFTAGAAGTSGLGGGAGGFDFGGGSGSGGGGFLGNGAGNNLASGGRGAAAGLGAGQQTSAAPGFGFLGASGGFGGGGAGLAGGGGGGGYSGGGGGITQYGGGGGGSFLIASATNGLFTSGTRSGNGAASVTLFSLADPVPEPSSWALLLCGFGSIGTTLRRRRLRTA